MGVSAAGVVGRRLFDDVNTLVGKSDSDQIILDFSGVKFMASAMLGKLVALQKKVQEFRAKMKLCSVAPEILEVFKITKVGQIAGCRITDGKATRNARVRVLRDNKQIFEGKVASLRENVLPIYEPGLEDLVATLTGRDVPMPTSALAVINFMVEDWSHVHQRAGRLEHIVTPKTLAAATD